MFEIKDQETFPHREERVLAFWERENIFLKSLEATKKGPLFSFYDGPPFATGLPHYGHILAGTIKDVVPRFWTMKGYHVPRRFGWDCHGLPVENEIEKAQDLSGAPEIEKFGVAKFNEECRSIVLRYTQEWEQTVKRMGRWVDFRQTYKTMDKSFMESVWWVFAELYKKGLVYEGYKVMPFSARLGTPLSNFEANLNYRDVDDPSLTVLFPLEDEPEVSLVAWTTTPWTLPSNLAVAVHPDLTYVKILAGGQQYILAEARLKANFKEYEVLETFQGKTLKDKRYKPLFGYFADRQDDQSFRVLTDEFVSIEDGSGIVHLAPAFGEADFFVCQKAGLEPVCPVDQNGRFTSEVPDYQGLFVKDADKEIIRRLKAEKRVLHHTQVRHRYPFCWRSDTPLIYKAVQTWFVAVEKIKDKLLDANGLIHWVPDHIKDGRFGKWLENARDWAISRNRYWGTPIPLWRSEDGEIRVMSSVKELEEKTGREIVDLHRHFIDDLTFVEKGKTFRRIPEVFDCWFESGSMPYAQNHFPFEHKEETLKAFPADFIGEGLDQTRGWFYTLHVLSVALFDKPAFKNVIVNGIILAEDGAKMSKRLKNYPEPGLMIERFGADAVRLYLMNSPAVMADDLRFSAKGVELVLRQALIPLWNCYVFLATYAKIYEWKPSGHFPVPKADIDRWILSVLQKLVQEVTQAMTAYELQAAVQPLVGFIDHLTDWYIRRNRGRFWADTASRDRDEAFETLYTVLQTLVRVTAPFVPFLSDAIYTQLRQKDDPISVHLCEFPTYQSKLRDPDLEKEMQSVQTVVGLGHSLRKEHKLKVRQPLAKADVICGAEDKLEALQRHQNLIAEELNVKEVAFHAEEAAFVTLQAKPNFRVLGKKVGKLMNAVQKAVEKLPAKDQHRLLKAQEVSLQVEGETIVLTPEDVTVERKVKENVIAGTEYDITVALETELTEDLIIEGIARELVNKINTMRREMNFAVTDRVHVKLDTSLVVKEAFEKHRDYICHEVLASDFAFEKCQGEEWDINGYATMIALQKALH
ncbi:MAG: isoleucine--tRNA ligase [Verrucomicrobia bacterium]|nr:isoleucine--tRNA ligase [Verrucomicrobiota bacterium]